MMSKITYEVEIANLCGCREALYSATKLAR